VSYTHILMGYKDIPEGSLQHSTAHCNTHTLLYICTYRWATRNPGGHFVSHCNTDTLLCMKTYLLGHKDIPEGILHHTAKRRNTLQHTHTAIYLYTPLGHMDIPESFCITLQHTATQIHCYVCRHTAGPQGHPGGQFAF